MGFIGTPVVERAAGGASFGYWIVDRCGEDVPAHGHCEAHIMWAVGGAYETSADRSAGRDTDILIYNPPGTYHADRFLSRGGFFTLKIERPPDTYENGAMPSQPECCDDEALRAVLRRLGRECVNWTDESEEIAEALCLEAIALVASETVARQRPPWLSRACDRLRDESNVSVKKLANDCGVHATHFIRSFRRFQRCTPGEYARAHRLEAAMRVLSTGKASIAETALATGFSDQSHLTRRFREAYGLTPGTYRAAMGLAPTER